MFYIHTYLYNIFLFFSQITCRNRDSGISFACTLCSKSFPTKRHLHEHNKRKHPSITENSKQSQRQQSQFNSQATNTTAPSSVQSNNQQQQQTTQPSVEQSFSTYDSNYYNYRTPSVGTTTDQYIKNENNNPQLMGHDLPLPQMSEDHNVGSLLRMVYPSDQLEQNHPGAVPNVHHEYTHQPNQNTQRPHSQVHHSYSSDMVELIPTSAMPVDFSALDYL